MIELLPSLYEAMHLNSDTIKPGLARGSVGRSLPFETTLKPPAPAGTLGGV